MLAFFFGRDGPTVDGLSDRWRLLLERVGVDEGRPEHRGDLYLPAAPHRAWICAVVAGRAVEFADDHRRDLNFRRCRGGD